MDTETRNISVNQCNQWEHISPTDLTDLHGNANINSPTRYAREKSFEPSGEIRNLNYPNLRQGVWLIKKTTQTTIPLRRTQRDRSSEVR